MDESEGIKINNKSEIFQNESIKDLKTGFLE